MGADVVAGTWVSACPSTSEKVSSRLLIGGKKGGGDVRSVTQPGQRGTPGNQVQVPAPGIRATAPLHTPIGERMRDRKID